MANPPSQSMLFHQFKPFTVPILGMLPIKDSAQSIHINPHLDSIQSVILNLPTLLLLTPPLVHYIFFPLEQLYHPINFQALTESCLNRLLKLSTILVQVSKSHPSNPLWLSKETFILGSIVPILTQRTSVLINSDQTNYPSSHLERSDESIIMVLDLTMAILSPDVVLANSKPTLDLDDLYQIPTNLATLPPSILRFLFEHLVDILGFLYQGFSSHAKQSQPSLARATQTIRLIKLSLVRLSSSNLPGASGIHILSTLLPSMTSKLVQLACLLAQRHQFSGLLSSILHAIGWVLVECLDEELPDIQEIISVSEFQSIDQQLESEDSSEAQVFDQILEIASGWKKSNPSHAGLPPTAPVLESPVFHRSADSQAIVVQRDRSWLVFTSTKLAIVLQRLSSSLDYHPNPIVLDAWVNVCCQLLDRSSTVLRIASPSFAPTTNQAGAQTKDGFRIVIESLLLHRLNTNINRDRIVSSLATVTKSSPLTSSQLIMDLIRVNFRSLSNLLLKQVSGQDDQITSLITQIISCLHLIIQLTNHQIAPSHFQRSGLDSIDMGEFYQLISLCMCRIELVIPKVIEFHYDALIPSSSSSGAFSITDDTLRNDPDSDNLPSSFPSLSVKQFFEVRCIKALEELMRTISLLALHLGNSNLGGASSWIRISEITYLDHLLQLSTSTNGKTPSDPHTRSQQLNALWALGQSIRPSKSISRDDQQRVRSRKIEVFCLQGLKKLLDMEETHRIEGNDAAVAITTARAEGVKDSSGLIGKIDQDLDNLPVTTYLKGNYHHVSELEKFKPVSLSKGYQKINQDTSFQTLRSCLLLRLISSFAYVFESSFQTNLSWILYYLLAQFGSPDPYLQQHATATLAEVSFYCGYGSSANMLEDNSDYLVQVISQKLLPYQYDHHAPFVLEHLIRLIGLPVILPLIEQVLLHDFFEILDDYHGYDLICQQLIGVFRCVMSLMKNQIETEGLSNHPNNLDDTRELKLADTGQETTEKNGIDEIFEVEQELATARWAMTGPPSDPSQDLNLFNNYQASRKKWIQVQKPSNDKQDKYNESKARGKNPRKPFGEIEGVDSIDPDHDPQPESSELATSSSMTGYQKIATELINKSANFLTHSSPFVQISVSQLINLAIPILGSKAVTPQESLLLPCIQKFWVVILNRLDQVYFLEKESHRRSSHDDRIEGKQHLIQIEVLHLFSSVCVHVGSFMNKKFANDVWPRIRKIISEESKILFTGSGFAGVHSISVSLINSCLETLFEIVHSSAGSTSNKDQSIRFKEELVWECVICLNQLKFRLTKISSQIRIQKKLLSLLNIIDQIFNSLIDLGFIGSVLVAEKAFNGDLEGLQYLSSVES